MSNTSEWKPDPSITRFVVCAAIKNEHGHIICGARHFDKIMRGQLEICKWAQLNITGIWEQGFIDQFGQWLTRSEALSLARNNDQIRHEVGTPGSNELFSENLY